jgi:uncharacterized phage infection (PIP) family protein YhgE
MSQPWYNVTEFGSNATSTGMIVIKTGPSFLHAVNVMTSGTGSIAFHNATSSGQTDTMLLLNPGVPNSYLIDAVFPVALARGNTTSTAEVTVTWA